MSLFQKGSGSSIYTVTQDCFWYGTPACGNNNYDGYNYSWLYCDFKVEIFDSQNNLIDTMVDVTNWYCDPNRTDGAAYGFTKHFYGLEAGSYFKITYDPNNNPGYNQNMGYITGTLIKLEY